MSEFIMRILHTAFFGHDVHSKIAPIHLMFHYHQLMFELDTAGVKSLSPFCACLSLKNSSSNYEKNQFINLDILYWRIAKIKRR